MGVPHDAQEVALPKSRFREAVQAVPRAICLGRFSLVSMFGGTDGGLRVNKGENFIFGPRAEFNDLWRLQLNEESARWEKLHGGSDGTYNAVEGQDVPRKAHMGGCACAAGKVYTFGGLCGDESEEPDGLEALGELWSWNIAEAAWSRAKNDGFETGRAVRVRHGVRRRWLFADGRTSAG